MGDYLYTHIIYLHLQSRESHYLHLQSRDIFTLTSVNVYRDCKCK